MNPESGPTGLRETGPTAVPGVGIFARLRVDVKSISLRSKSAFWALFLFKVAYLSCVAAAVLLWPAGRDSEMARYDRIKWTASGHPEFKSYFTSWDVGHYLYLSEHGYQAGKNSCAFYPLWPLLLRWSSVAFGGEEIFSGTLLANILSLAGLFLFFNMAATRLGSSVAWRSLVLLLAFPGSLFFQFMYSESLFFLLLLLLCLAMERRRTWLAAMTAFLLPLARPLGFLCTFPISVYLMRGSRQRFCAGLSRLLGSGRLETNSGAREARADLNASGDPTGPGRNLSWWVLAAPFCGWVLYFLLMWQWTGNPFEGFAAQKFWGVQSVGNLFNLPQFAVALFTPTTWHAFAGSLLDRCGFILLLYTLPLIWRMDRVWFAWTVVLAIVPAMSGHFTSFIRFESVAFPMFVALGAWLSQPKRRSLWLCCLGLFILLHVVLLRRHIYFEWAG